MDMRKSNQWDLNLRGFKPENILLISGTGREDITKVRLLLINSWAVNEL
jgi:hypothetical protein